MENSCRGLRRQSCKLMLLYSVLAVKTEHFVMITNHTRSTHLRGHRASLKPPISYNNVRKIITDTLKHAWLDRLHVQASYEHAKTVTPNSEHSNGHPRAFQILCNLFVHPSTTGASPPLSRDRPPQIFAVVHSIDSHHIPYGATPHFDSACTPRMPRPLLTRWHSTSSSSFFLPR